MDTHSNTTTFSPAADFLFHLPSPDALLPLMNSASQYHHLMPDQLTMKDLDSLSQLNSEMSHNSCSSGGSSYGSPSYGTQRPGLMQRSVSSHSLLKNAVHHPLSARFADLLESENGPVRRVYSTGDLQRINALQHSRQSDSPLSESSMIIEGMNRACRYSPEEKKVRIERYRIKRNQRNFNKKIKYACRKTLADSRPRIRGRFARNGEIEKNPPAVEWSQIGGEEEDEEDENWVNFFDNLVAANLLEKPQDDSTFGLLF